MQEALIFIIGLAAGGIITWLVLKSGSKAHIEDLRKRASEKDAQVNDLQTELSMQRQSRAVSETRFEEASKNLDAQKELINTMEEKLKETFKALSKDALTDNSTEFLKLAGTELEGKKELIDQNLEALEKVMQDVKKKVEDVDKGNTKVAERLSAHNEITDRLSQTTLHLRQALASSKKRGEWGERMAEDVIRLVGMVEGINYIKQKTLEGSSGRPDYTFFLPNKLKVNMDVKFPMENYQRFLDAESEHDRKRHREELLKGTKLMIREVAKNREYINPADNTVDYVIVFIPNEQVYSFLNESDHTLMDESLKQKAILCSPFTLYAVLAVIRQAVENFNLEKTASEILNLLAEFSKQWSAYKEKFRHMGERLDAAKKEYDSLLVTRSNMLDRPLKKIEELRRQKDIEIGEVLRLEEDIPLE